MKILILDNFDSFTFNLFQLVHQTGRACNINISKIDVIRNNDTRLNTLSQGDYQSIIISPGPGTPEDTGFAPNLLAKFAGYIPILGVCLGHQLIASHFGGCNYSRQNPNSR